MEEPITFRRPQKRFNTKKTLAFLFAGVFVFFCATVGHSASAVCALSNAGWSDAEAYVGQQVGVNVGYTDCTGGVDFAIFEDDSTGDSYIKNIRISITGGSSGVVGFYQTSAFTQADYSAGGPGGLEGDNLEMYFAASIGCSDPNDPQAAGCGFAKSGLLTLKPPEYGCVKADGTPYPVCYISKDLCSAGCVNVAGAGATCQPCNQILGNSTNDSSFTCNSTRTACGPTGGFSSTIYCDPGLGICRKGVGGEPNSPSCVGKTENTSCVPLICDQDSKTCRPKVGSEVGDTTSCLGSSNGDSCAPKPGGKPVTYQCTKTTLTVSDPDACNNPKGGWLPLVPCGRSDQCGMLDTDGSPCDECQFCDLFRLVQNILLFTVFELIPPIAIFFIALGGLLILLSAGNESRRSQGKAVLRTTIIGIIVIFTSWIIINTVIKTFAVNLAGGSGTTWYTFSCSGGAGAPPASAPGCVTSGDCSGNQTCDSGTGTCINKYDCSGTTCQLAVDGPYSVSNCGGNCTGTACTPNCSGRACGSDPACGVSCGNCPNATDTCNASGQCISACIPETDAAFCARFSRACGSASGTDNCGNARAVPDCGSCSIGTCNTSGQCACSSTETLCAGACQSNPTCTGACQTGNFVCTPGGSLVCTTSPDGGACGASQTCVQGSCVNRYECRNASCQLASGGAYTAPDCLGSCAVPSCSLTATPQIISSGLSSTLTWTSTGNATSAFIDQGVGAVAPPAGGSTQTSPATNTIYTLTVGNANGSSTCSASVAVTQAPCGNGSSSCEPWLGDTCSVCPECAGNPYCMTAATVCNRFEFEGGKPGPTYDQCRNNANTTLINFLDFLSVKYADPTRDIQDLGSAPSVVDGICNQHFNTGGCGGFPTESCLNNPADCGPCPTIANISDANIASGLCAPDACSDNICSPTACSSSLACQYNCDSAHYGGSSACGAEQSVAVDFRIPNSETCTMLANWSDTICTPGYNFISYDLDTPDTLHVSVDTSAACPASPDWTVPAQACP
ncbi:MAG: hypothetical protein Q7S09_01570 [bacterium]|nr:hypothetical protein [bacterium]